MTAAEILVKIRTMFERKGADDATASMRQTAQAAKETGQQVSQAGQKGADGLNVMSIATAAMQGNFNGAAAAAIPLIEKSKAAGLSLTQLSLAGAALTAVVAGLKALSDWADAAAQRIAKIQMDNLTNKVNASAAAYEKLVEAMRKSEADRDATLAYNNSMVDSYTKQALAVNELNKQKELSTTADESQRREIEAKYASKAADIAGLSDVEKEANERKRSIEREQKIEDAIKASKLRQDELLSEAKEGLTKGLNASATARKSNTFWKTLVDKGSNTDSYLGLAKEAGATTGKSIELAQNEERRREQLEAERLEIRRSRSVSGVNATSGSILRQASELSAQTSASDRARTNQEALYSAGATLQTTASRLATADQQVVADELNRLDKAGQLTVEAVTRMTQNLERIIQAYDAQESRMRNF